MRIARALALLALLPAAAWGDDLYDRIEGVVEDLRSADVAKRRDAVDRLEEFDAEAAAPHLLRALVDGDPEVRTRAAGALGRRRVTASEPALLERLNDAEPRVRAQA